MNHKNKFVLRMTDNLMRENIKKIAKENYRSMNAELLLLIEQGFKYRAATKTTVDLDENS